MQEEDNAQIIFPSGGGGEEANNIRNVCLAFLLAILR